MITNCINCGAPLHDGKCDYCGSEYSKNTPVSVDRLDRIGADVTIRIGGEEYNCYLGDCEMYAVEIGGGGRAMDGSIWRGEITHKRKFTFIEC